MERTLTADWIGRRIYLIRGHKVMLDRDLATLYGVPTKSLNLAVKRNASRFPNDFMFQLTNAESHSLRFQFETLKTGRGRHPKYLPHVFTEQGVAMLSSVLRSERAVQVNIVIMRAFIKLRETLCLHKELAAQFAELERRVRGHDAQIRCILRAIRQLMSPSKEPPPPPEEPTRRIGFQPESA